MTFRLLIALMLVSSLAAQRPRADESLQREAALGALMAKQFRERQGTVGLPEVQAYLERVVRQLAAAQPGDGAYCTVALFAREEADAKPVAYPGGYLFVPAKLFFTSPDETAFVQALGHAVAHIRRRDWVRVGAQRADLASIPVDVLWAEQDRAESVPLKLRPELEARENLADEAAERSVRFVTMGSGEFERLRDHAPLPTPRPALLP